MTKEELIINEWYYTDGTVLKTCLRKLKYVGNKYVIVESKNGKEESITLNMLLEFGSKA